MRRVAEPDGWEEPAHAGQDVAAPGGARSRHVELQRRIVESLGFSVPPSCTVLDFGCGAGATVIEYRSLGFDAYGADILLDRNNPYLRLITTGRAYRLPFEDETFDFVYSDQVFEHVRDHATALAEIWRVLKPGGVSLHVFPPKNRPIEAHTLVPFAGIVKNRGWLSLWALLGVRNIFQRGLPYNLVAERNHVYLRENTCYLTKARLRELILARFSNVTFAEFQFIKHSYGRSHHLYPLVRICPWLAHLYSSLHQRVVFFRKCPAAQ